MKVLHNLLTVVICFQLSLFTVHCTLSKSDKSKSKKKETTVKLSSKNVIKRGLVTKDIKVKDIVKDHKSYCELETEIKQFEGDVLAYVTPWNSHGYDVAKIFGSKFNMVSPVWLQIKRKPSGAYLIQGQHDVDQGWVKVVTKNRRTKILPRVLFDGWSGSDYQALFTREDAIEDCIHAMLDFVKENSFPGIVLEVWSQLGGQLRRELIHFLTHLAQEFHSNKKMIVLVLPPPISGHDQSPGMVNKENFDALAPYVDGFSLMTYDFSNPIRPGPNSPMDWIRSCVEALVPDETSPYRKKILLGFNFYGNDYVPGGGGPILGNQYIEIVQKHKPKIEYKEKWGEHLVKYKTGIGEHHVFFPTLFSIQKRIELAKSLGTGISIWEIGQGLDYWYDLL